MKIKALTTVAVRIFGLFVLYRGVTSTITVAMLYALQVHSRAPLNGPVVTAGSNGGLESLMLTGLSNLTLNCIFQLICGILLLAYGRPLADLLMKGLDENS